MVIMAKQEEQNKNREIQKMLAFEKAVAGGDLLKAVCACGNCCSASQDSKK